MIKKLENHRSIINITRHMTGKKVFEFTSVSPLEAEEEINTLDSSKKTSGQVSTDVVKLISGCSLENITYFINKIFSVNEFTRNLKLADVVGCRDPLYTFKAKASLVVADHCFWDACSAVE